MSRSVIMPITFPPPPITGSVLQLYPRMTPAAATRVAFGPQDVTYADIISLTFTLNLLSNVNSVKNYLALSCITSVSRSVQSPRRVA